MKFLSLPELQQIWLVSYRWGLGRYSGEDSFLSPNKSHEDFKEVLWNLSLWYLIHCGHDSTKISKFSETKWRFYSSPPFSLTHWKMPLKKYFRTPENQSLIAFLSSAAIRGERGIDEKLKNSISRDVLDPFLWKPPRKIPSFEGNRWNSPAEQHTDNGSRSQNKNSAVLSFLRL